MGKSAQLIHHSKLVAGVEDQESPLRQQEDTTLPNTRGTLTPEQVWSIRKMMAGLAIVQLSIGIAVSAVTITGAAEVVQY